MIGISTYSMIALDRVETLWCFRALWGESSRLCSKMQIGLVETFNKEQRNKILAYVKTSSLYCCRGGVCEGRGSVEVNLLAL